MLQAQQEWDLPQEQEAFLRPGNRAGGHIPTQAGFQVPPCVGAQLPVGDTVREGGGDGAGREGHQLCHLPQPGLQGSQAPHSPHQGAAVLPHVHIDALGKGQDEGWEQRTVPPVTATCDTCHPPGVKHTEAGITECCSLPEAGERRFQGPHTWSESPRWCPAAGTEQHQPLRKMEVLAELGISLQSLSQSETKQSVFSAQPASGKGAPPAIPCSNTSCSGCSQCCLFLTRGAAIAHLIAGRDAGSHCKGRKPECIC